MQVPVNIAQTLSTGTRAKPPKPGPNQRKHQAKTFGESEMSTRSISTRVPQEIADHLAAEARRRSVTKSDLIREILTVRYLGGGPLRTERSLKANWCQHPDHPLSWRAGEPLG